ncbi:cornifelin homolog [Ruditapes philippinarum]|uniref:cornifelin homolog n=1 Tax=Ruditapes philippinarum TaxID=129788 RepID=UPI00295B577E|nr:cornifelin homolog [Ruditapes philippinarum]
MAMTHVVVNQPMAGRQMLVGSVEGHRDWDSGLFSCCTDCKSLLMTYCCLPCAICNISNRVGECSCMPWFVPGALVALRARIRTLGGIQGSICTDCMTMSFCGLCAICQMQRELDAMGL